MSSALALNGLTGIFDQKNISFNDNLGISLLVRLVCPISGRGKIEYAIDLQESIHPEV